MPLQATSGAASYDGFGGGVAAVPNYIEDVFSTYLYSGNDSTQTITNNIDISTKGALVWVKGRSGTYGTFDHTLITTPVSNTTALSSNTTSDTFGIGSSAFSPTTTGFNLNTASASLNNNGTNYASWTFRQQDKFFKIVSWTGDGTGTRTITHNLQGTVGCVIAKQTNGTGVWVVQHQALTNAWTAARLFLNTTGAVNAYSNFTNPTNTTIDIDSNLNGSGAQWIAYFFAHNAGGFGLTGTDNVISCGSFTTDGSGNATVNLGYEPQWVMYKRADGAGSWAMFDNMRGMTVNTTNGDAILFANLADAESTVDWIQPTSTGFNPYNIAWNATYIYIAIRRGPMKVPTDGTKVFSPNLSNAVSGTAVTTGFTLDLQIVGCRPNYGLSVSNAFMDRLRGVSPRI